MHTGAELLYRIEVSAKVGGSLLVAAAYHAYYYERIFWEWATENPRLMCATLISAIAQRRMPTTQAKKMPKVSTAVSSGLKISEANSSSRKPAVGTFGGLATIVYRQDIDVMNPRKA